MTNAPTARRLSAWPPPRFDMTMPTVTELPRVLEPVTLDPFIDGLNVPASEHSGSPAVQAATFAAA